MRVRNFPNLRLHANHLDWSRFLTPLVCGTLLATWLLNVLWSTWGTFHCSWRVWEVVQVKQHNKEHANMRGTNGGAKVNQNTYGILTTCCWSKGGLKVVTNRNRWGCLSFLFVFVVAVASSLAETRVFVSLRPAQCFVPAAVLCWLSAPYWPSSPSSCPAEGAKGGSAPWPATCRWLQVSGDASSARAVHAAVMEGDKPHDKRLSSRLIWSLGFLILEKCLKQSHSRQTIAF